MATVAGAAIGGSALLASGAQAANFPVSNLNNAGAGSLRGAILSANGAAGPDSISFTGAGASGEIILLTEIPVTDDLTINGPGAATLAVSGDSNNNNVRDFATSAVALGDTRIFSISDPSSPGSPLAGGDDLGADAQGGGGRQLLGVHSGGERRRDLRGADRAGPDERQHDEQRRDGLRRRRDVDEYAPGGPTRRA